MVSDQSSQRAGGEGERPYSYELYPPVCPTCHMDMSCVKGSSHSNAHNKHRLAATLLLPMR